MAPLLLWTAAFAALASLSSVGVSAMPMLPEQGETRLSVPPQVLEWYLQQRGDQSLRDLALRDDRDVALEQMLQKEEFVKQFRQWLDTQMARLPALSGMADDEPNKALAPQPPAKRGNYMALCHFKICNMGRKRSPRLQPQELP